MTARTAILPYWLETLLIFKLSWVLLVVGNTSGVLPALLLFAFSVARHTRPAGALRTLVPTAALGLGLDVLLALSGIYTFDGALFPIWLVVLWLSFAHALHHALVFLRNWPVPVVALLGALTGPASYLLGHLLGAVDFPHGLLPTLVLLGLCWALLLPLTLWMANSPAGVKRELRSLLLLCCATAGLPFVSDPLHASDNALRLQGEARMSVLFRPIYDIRLFVPDGNRGFSFPAQQTYTLELQYRLDIPAQTLLKETLKQWQAQGVDARPDWIRSLEDAFPTVQSGDRLALVVTPEGAVLLHNDAPGARLRDTELVEAFAGIWLADNTTQPGLRRKLLGSP